jgi:hypothetical protein
VVRGEGVRGCFKVNQSRKTFFFVIYIKSANDKYNNAIQDGTQKQPLSPHPLIPNLIIIIKKGKGGVYVEMRKR